MSYFICRTAVATGEQQTKVNIDQFLTHTEMTEEMEEPGKLEEEVVRELCQDYARFTRVNISEEHGQVRQSELRNE